MEASRMRRHAAESPYRTPLEVFGAYSGARAGRSLPEALGRGFLDALPIQCVALFLTIASADPWSIGDGAIRLTLPAGLTIGLLCIAAVSTAALTASAVLRYRTTREAIVAELMKPPPQAADRD